MTRPPLLQVPPFPNGLPPLTNDCFLSFPPFSLPLFPLCLYPPFLYCCFFPSLCSSSYLLSPSLTKDDGPIVLQL